MAAPHIRLRVARRSSESSDETTQAKAARPRYTVERQAVSIGSTLHAVEATDSSEYQITAAAATVCEVRRSRRARTRAFLNARAMAAAAATAKKGHTAASSQWPGRSRTLLANRKTGPLVSTSRIPATATTGQPVIDPAAFATLAAFAFKSAVAGREHTIQAIVESALWTTRTLSANPPRSST